MVLSCHPKLKRYSNKRNVILNYQHLNDSTLLISKTSADPSFGFSESNPIRVGLFNLREGAENVEKYLNALIGPNGEQIRYFRLKPCCPFKTKNFIDKMPVQANGGKNFDGKYGLLEKYKVDILNGKVSCILFFNLYDEAKILQAPYGFNFKTK